MKRVWSICLAAAVVLALVSAQPAAAQTSAQQPFTLAPGGKATVTYEAFCTEFGKLFPASGLQAPNGNLAPDRVRAALAYIQQKGYSADAAKALESQYAIWQILGAANSPAGGATTQEVVAAATTAPANPQGTSVLDAAKAGQVKVTQVSWAPIGEKVQIGSATDYFYGRGTLTIENTSQQSLSLFMPVGTLLPPATANNQIMGGYATQVQVTNPAPAQPAAQLPATGGSGASSDMLLFMAAALLGLGVLTSGVRRASVRK